MTKTEVIKKVADCAGLSPAQAKRTLDCFEEVIKNGIKKHQPMPLLGLGKFLLVERSARMGRNPATGETIRIPAKKVLKFRASKVLKDL